MAVTIEPAQPQDFPAVAALLASHALPLDGLEEHLGTLLVAHAERGTRKCEGGIRTEPSAFRGPTSTGLGRQLTAAALELGRAHGVRAVYLLTETALHFFPRLGFAPVARDAVAPAIQQSVEWTSACPVSAQVLVRHLEAAPTPAGLQGATRG